MSDTEVNISIPQTILNYFRDQHITDHEDGETALQSEWRDAIKKGHAVRQGRGWSVRITLSLAAAHDLTDEILDRADVQAMFEPGERDIHPSILRRVGLRLKEDVLPALAV